MRLASNNDCNHLTIAGIEIAFIVVAWISTTRTPQVQVRGQTAGHLAWHFACLEAGRRLTGLTRLGLLDPVAGCPRPSDWE